MDSNLSDEQIKRIAEEYPSHLTQKVRAQDKELYEYVNKNFEGEKFAEKLYRFVYGCEDSICDMSDCEKTVSFLSFTRGFKEFCSRSCGAKKEGSKENIECAYCEKKINVYKCEDQKYCSHECYIKHKTQKGEFDEQLDKARKAYREKYDGMGFGSNKIRKKIRNTMEDKYGDKFYVNVKKMKETKKKKYGDPNYNNRKKRRQTCQEKYNNPHYSNREQAAETRKDNKYEEVCNDPKFSSVYPLFSKEEYDGAEGFVKYPFKCNGCDEEFEDYLYSGNVPRCPNCYDGWNHVGASGEEKTITTFVEKVLPENQEVVKNDKSVLDGKELDIYIPGRDIAIEYNGLYWHSETQGGKDKQYHLKKTEACEEAGIQLIHIFENEWILRRDTVKKKLTHILKNSSDTVHANSCKVDTITNEEARAFLEEHHLQGYTQSSFRFGLFLKNELVGVMTFEKASTDNPISWKIKRSAFSKHVEGAAQKLFTEFRRRQDPNRVLIYADRRWRSKLNNVYKNIGFELKNITEPSYYYFEESSTQLYPQTTFRKEVLNEKLENFDSTLTEWENMQNHGFDRIWDCGHLKYIWTKN